MLLVKTDQNRCFSLPLHPWQKLVTVNIFSSFVHPQLHVLSFICCVCDLFTLQGSFVLVFVHLNIIGCCHHGKQVYAHDKSLLSLLNVEHRQTISYRHTCTITVYYYTQYMSIAVQNHACIYDHRFMFLSDCTSSQYSIWYINLIRM